MNPLILARPLLAFARCHNLDVTGSSYARLEWEDWLGDELEQLRNLVLGRIASERDEYEQRKENARRRMRDLARAHLPMWIPILRIIVDRGYSSLQFSRTPIPAPMKIIRWECRGLKDAPSWAALDKLLTWDVMEEINQLEEIEGFSSSYAYAYELSELLGKPFLVEFISGCYPYIRTDYGIEQ